MTNYERVISMNIIEMAKFLARVDLCERCIHKEDEAKCFSDNTVCSEGIVKWLEQKF